VAAGIDPKSPIVRWLQKWNAAKSAGKPAGTDDSSGLRKILESVRTGGPAKQDAKKNSGKKPSRKNAKAASPDEPGKNMEPGIAVAGTGETAADQTPAPVKEPVPVHDVVSSDGGTGVPGETGRDSSSLREKSGEAI
jgi:hypothetical protein